MEKLTKEQLISQAQIILTQEKIDYTAKSDIQMEVLDYSGEPIDFWPTTGKWKYREDGKSGKGIRNLVREIQSPYLMEPAPVKDCMVPDGFMDYDDVNQKGLFDIDGVLLG